MKLLTGFYSLVCCGMLVFCPVTNSFAKSDSDYVASISYSSSSQATSTVYNSYRQLYTLERKLEALSKYAIRALNDTLTSDDLYYLDLKFQAQKHRVGRLLNQSVINFPLISENEYFIDIRNDGKGNHLKIHLNFNALDKQIWADQLSTAAEAQQAIYDIDNMLQAIHEMLPLDTRNTGKNANHDSTTWSQTDRKLNEFKIARQEDSDALLKSLIHLHDQLTSRLHRLRELALQAANESQPNPYRDQINDEFQAILIEFGMEVSTSSIGNVTIFNDNQFKLYIDGKSKNYYFPRLDLNTLNLADANLSTRVNAVESWIHLIIFYEWLEEWTVTGKSPLKLLDQLNNPLLKLSPKEKENLLNTYVVKYKM